MFYVITAILLLVSLIAGVALTMRADKRCEEENNH